MCDTFEEFTFIWSIENFHMCGGPISQGFCGPTFYLKNFNDTQWYLVLSPRWSESDKEYIACELRRGYDDGPEHVEVDFKLSMGSRKFKNKHVFGKLESHGFNKFIERKSTSRFNLNLFVIECNMRMKRPVEENDHHPNKSVFSSLLSLMKAKTSSEGLFQKRSSVAKKQSKELNKKQLKYFPRVHYHCRLPVEKRSIMYPISEIVSLSRDTKLQISVTSQSRYPPFLITMYSNLNEGDIEIEVTSIFDLLADVLLLCEIELLDSRNAIIKYMKDELNFKRTVTDEFHYQSIPEVKMENIRHFKHVIKKRDLQIIEDGNLHIMLTMSISYFDWEYCIINSDYDFTSPEEETSCSILSREMSRLYSQKKLCDLSLKTKDKTFEVHRNVLVSMSPVFESKFENGLLEAGTCVFIDDLDSDTVSQMINFMYSEEVEGIQFESALKLYIAADMYQIECLKDKCRDFLKKNCSLEHLSSITHLADTYKDEELKGLVADYAYDHKNVVMSSSEWKSILNNIHEHPL